MTRSRWTYEVTLPDGVVATRTTQSKEYLFVVVGEARPWTRDGQAPFQWCALRWSETARSANAYAGSLNGKDWARNVRVLECRLQEPAEGRRSMPRTKKGAAPVAPEATEPTTDGPAAGEGFDLLGDDSAIGAPAADGATEPAAADTVADKPKRGRSRKAAATPAPEEAPAPARRSRRRVEAAPSAVSAEQFREMFPKATDAAVGLAVDVVAQVTSAIPDLEIAPRQQFLGLKAGKQMVLSVIPTKAGLRLVLPLEPSAHLGIAGTRDVSKVGHWGVGGLEWKVDGETDPGQIVLLVSEAVEVHRPAA